MIKVTDKSECCGCTACKAVCPHEAISMRPDALGFMYPVTDADRCTDCGLCEKVCAFRTPVQDAFTPKAMAVRNRDEESLMQSRSGAVFPVIAADVIARGGTVYGAAFDNGFRVIHSRAENMQEADAFRGSKYVQSDMNDMFRKVRNDLMEGRPVFFTGTPCQVHGLLSYIPDKLREKLLTADIVCHGVPSPYVWRDYLGHLERRHGGRVSEVSFRDKKIYGWAAHKETYRIDGKMFTESSFTHLFYRHIMLRPSCAVCQYASTKRCSDITLADFWGWQKSVPGFNDDDKGVSLVLVSSSEGASAIERCRGCLEIREVSLENCLQPNLLRPSAPDKDSAMFAEDFSTKGIDYVLKRYGDQGWRYKVYTLYMNMKRRIKGWVGK